MIFASAFFAMKYSTNKDFNKLIQSLIRHGWSFRKKRKHNQIIAPNGRSVTFSKSPSDYRALKNFTNDIKHAQQGLPL